MPGLNQMESFFRVSRINLLHDKYETKRMHSRLLVRIKHDAKEVSLGVARHVTARPQLQLQLTAPPWRHSWPTCHSMRKAYAACSSTTSSATRRCYSTTMPRLRSYRTLPPRWAIR